MVGDVQGLRSARTMTDGRTILPSSEMEMFPFPCARSCRPANMSSDSLRRYAGFGGRLDSPPRRTMESAGSGIGKWSSSSASSATVKNDVGVVDKAYDCVDADDSVKKPECYW